MITYTSAIPVVGDGSLKNIISGGLENTKEIKNTICLRTSNHTFCSKLFHQFYYQNILLINVLRILQRFNSAKFRINAKP